MESKKENIKSLFSNSRTRIIIIFTFFILILSISIALIHMHNASVSVSERSTLGSTPGIRSIPGALDPTAQYVKLQDEANVRQAKTALTKGGSAIPTLIRMQKLGEGVEPIMEKGSVGFVGLNRQGQDGEESPWYEALKAANCSKASMNNAMKAGASLSALHQACSCRDLRELGYTLIELASVCKCPELKEAGFNAGELKASGYDAVRLRKCGFSACQMQAAGFKAEDLLDAGYSHDELKGAGYPEKDLSFAAGLPAGVTVDDVHKAGCDLQSLIRLREKGVSAGSIRRMNGCSAAQLKAAGYTAQQLRAAGYTAAELAKAGFTPEELKKAGFAARDLLNAGFTPKQLEDAGYNPAEIKEAEAELPPGITASDVKAAGCDPEALKKERLAGVSAALIRKFAGCSAAALKAAGFSDAELANAGFTPAQIAAAIEAAKQADKGKLSDEAIRAAGCTPQGLKALRNEGVSVQKIRELNRCTAQELKDAGFTAKELAAALTPAQLLAAGFTPEELNRAGINPSAAIAAGRAADCSPSALKAAYLSGVSASSIRETLGCSAAAMKEAGYSAAQLKDAGFTAGELKNAGFSADQLKAAGFSAKGLRDAGFAADELKNAGFNAGELKDAGFTPGELKKAGFTPAELKSAGFTDAELAKAGIVLPNTAVAGLAGLPAGAPSPSTLTAFPGVVKSAEGPQNAGLQQLQAIVSRQNMALETQQSQQAIQNRVNTMAAAASQLQQRWKMAPTQTYVASQADDKKDKTESESTLVSEKTIVHGGAGSESGDSHINIKAGDIIFAVIDTTVNTDQPSPILATIVSGPLAGSKLIGSFTLPPNGDKMVILFNTLSVAGVTHTQSINAFAIDPETGRTALSGRVNHHYLSRYGSMFAASFIEGFGNAFQSANTSVTIGGTGGGDNITVQNGIGRSALENAVIGLATVGKSWGQVAQQNMNRPTTIEVFSGTGVGILFTQDASIAG